MILDLVVKASHISRIKEILKGSEATFESETRKEKSKIIYSFSILI